MVNSSRSSQEPLFKLRQVSVKTPQMALVKGVDLHIYPHRVMTLMGPSGAGKSTLLKCLNRFHELSEGIRVEGQITFHGKSIFDRSVEVDDHRRRVGMLFQQPVVFPKDIFQNVIFGAKRVHALSKSEQAETVERCLREVHLWNEVKDRLHQAAHTLSIGQQQRLCLARALAVNPEVILMDEPTSALDSKTTSAINALIQELKVHCTIVLVSHDRAQALEVSDDLVWIEATEQGGQVGFVGSKAAFEAFEAHRLPLAS